VGTARVSDSKPSLPPGSDSPEKSLLSRTQAMQQIKFQQLRTEGIAVQREAADKFRTGQTDAALDLLQDYLAGLADVQLEPGQLTLLKRPVESRLQHFRLMKAQQDLTNSNAAALRASRDAVDHSRKLEETRQKNVARLMKEFNTLFKEGKYPEAESLAMRAHELDPDNGVVTAAVYIARQQRRVNDYKAIKNGKEEIVLTSLNNAEEEGPASAINTGITVDKGRSEVSRRRAPLDGMAGPRKKEGEREIERKLSTPVNLNFTDVPLKSVIEDLRAYNGINIYVDEPALNEAGISLDHPVSIKLEQVSLKSALNLLLHGVHLTYVVKDEVLQVTTEDHARGKLETHTFQVADLVIPIENFGDLRNPVTPLVQGTPTGPSPTAAAPTPVTGPMSITAGTSVGSPTGGSAFASAGDSRSGEIKVSGKNKPTQTQEDTLIKLIQSTVAPRSWSEMGGPGTIDYFPLTMSLVISQTPDIQEQIADLLAALRRLQDQEVAVEVRFITVNENFFERIGVNFNVNILDSSSNHRLEPLLTSGQFANAGQINAFDPGRFIAGLTPAGTFTSNLDIPITTQTFQQAIPPFGGYTGVPGYGGITMGLAFLSDIQVFLFLEAVQGDTRTNVMQAPKLSLFNGQTASLNVTDQQIFVTGVQVSSQQGQFLYTPQIQTFPIGVNLTIQAVISADRRFVRMSLTPTLTNLATPLVELFPVVTPIFPLFDGTATGQPIVFTQFIQQPIVATVGVQTTVAVPDGGTVLLGGLKRLSEGRNEFGPPILSKIPFINRLFKNVGYGREAESLLIMVTPRIIIQEEEEERQTGYRAPPAVTP
jgi:type II secretory pathway component GspD/PulD (secretin)